MKKENKNKIAVIGHTKGIGKAIVSLYRKNNFEVVGLSRTNGFDLENNQHEILDSIDDCGLVVLNAFAGQGQLHLLKRIYGRYMNRSKKIVVITSTSGTPEGEDADLSISEYKQYCKLKKELIEYISDLQQELILKPLSVYDVCPDVVDTDMTKGLWEDLPKLKANEVAEAVKYCFDSTFNINKLVMQKNVS